MKTKKKRSAKERETFQTVTLGQAFCDDWNAAGNKAEQSVLSDAAVRYSLTREEPTPDERAKIGMAWGGVKCEIDRISKWKERRAASARERHMTIGETLRKARAARGFTIQDIANETAIRRCDIERMENDDFTMWPHPIYGKGFIRIYARHLNLDPDPLIRQYLDATAAWNIRAPERS